MRGLVGFALIVGLLLPQPGAAQNEQTLADIRQELTVLYVEVQRLKRELSTTGSVSTTMGGGTALERIDGIEAELQRLTGKTEELEFRINSVVRDGTNRIGDLEFRLVELEGGDVSKLGETTTLGGGEMPVTPVAVPPKGDISELAVGEESDFTRAGEALVAGNYRAAAEQFGQFIQTYPGSPLEPAAHLKRGEALEGAGDMTEAARAYLDAFSRAPEGPAAPDALYRLGNALGRLGQTNEACVTLSEVEVRFPQSSAVLDAKSAMRNLGCS